MDANTISLEDSTVSDYIINHILNFDTCISDIESQAESEVVSESERECLIEFVDNTDIQTSYIGQISNNDQNSNERYNNQQMSESNIISTTVLSDRMNHVLNSDSVSDIEIQTVGDIITGPSNTKDTPKIVKNIKNQNSIIYNKKQQQFLQEISSFYEHCTVGLNKRKRDFAEDIARLLHLDGRLYILKPKINWKDRTNKERFNNIKNAGICLREHCNNDHNKFLLVHGSDAGNLQISKVSKRCRLKCLQGSAERVIEIL